MATDGIVKYPAGAIKLNKFFGQSVRVLVDGTAFEAHRLDIIFPSETDLKTAMQKLVRVACSNREDAVRFILGVLDEFSSGSANAKPETKEIVG
jgi:hypothetical protein